MQRDAEALTFVSGAGSLGCSVVSCCFAGGCDQSAAGCEPHHVVHRADGGHTSLTGLKNRC